MSRFNPFQGAALVPWILVVSWVVFWHGLLTAPGSGRPHSWFYGYCLNLGHAVIMGGFALLLVLAFSLSGMRGLKVFFIALGASLLWAVLEEIIQAGIPTRGASIFDVVTGGMGAAFCLQCLWVFVIKRGISMMGALYFVMALISAFIETGPPGGS